MSVYWRSLRRLTADSLFRRVRGVSAFLAGPGRSGRTYFSAEIEELLSGCAEFTVRFDADESADAYAGTEYRFAPPQVIPGLPGVVVAPGVRARSATSSSPSRALPRAILAFHSQLLPSSTLQQRRSPAFFFTASLLPF